MSIRQLDPSNVRVHRGSRGGENRKSGVKSPLLANTHILPFSSQLSAQIIGRPPGYAWSTQVSTSKNALTHHGAQCVVDLRGHIQKWHGIS